MCRIIRGNNFFALLFALLCVEVGAADVVLAEKPLWQTSLGGAALTEPCCAAGSVVAVCEGGFVRAFNYEGAPLWTYRIHGKFAPFIARTEDGITYAAQDSAGGAKTIIALSKSGHKISTISLAYPLKEQPRIGNDGRLFVLQNDVWISYTLQGQKLGEQREYLPVEDGDNPYFKRSLTRAWEVDGAGKVKWALNIKDAAALPAYDAGLLFVSYKNWLLAAYRANTDGVIIEKKLPPPYGLGKKIPFPSYITLDVVKKKLKDGNIGSDEHIFASFLMGKGDVQPRLMGRGERAGIMERGEALLTLGRLGSPEYVPFLLDVLLRETDPYIRTSALRAIGNIGIDRTDRAFPVISYIFLPALPRFSESLVGAMLWAVGRLCIVGGAEVKDAADILGSYSAQRWSPQLSKTASSWISRLVSIR